MEWAYLLTGGGLVLIGTLLGAAIAKPDKKETDV